MPGLQLVGEFAPTLWTQGKVDAAIQVEHLTDEVCQDLQRGYFVRVCLEHVAAGTGKPYVPEDLCRALIRSFPVNGLSTSVEHLFCIRARLERLRKN